MVILGELDIHTLQRNQTELCSLFSKIDETEFYNCTPFDRTAFNKINTDEYKGVQRQLLDIIESAPEDNPYKNLQFILSMFIGKQFGEGRVLTQLLKIFFSIITSKQYILAQIMDREFNCPVFQYGALSWLLYLATDEEVQTYGRLYSTLGNSMPSLCSNIRDRGNLNKVYGLSSPFVPVKAIIDEANRQNCLLCKTILLEELDLWLPMLNPQYMLIVPEMFELYPLAINSDKFQKYIKQCCANNSINGILFGICHYILRTEKLSDEIVNELSEILATQVIPRLFTCNSCELSKDTLSIMDDMFAYIDVEQYEVLNALLIAVDFAIKRGTVYEY